MNPVTGPKIIVSAIAALIIIGAAVFGVDSCHKKQATSSQTQADVARGAANAHEEQAKASDAKVADLQAKLDAKESDLGRLSSERDVLLRKLASHSGQHPVVVSPSDSGGEVVADDRDSLIVDLKAVVAKDAEVIQQQSEVIQAQKIDIQVITQARDEWKATADYREKQAMAQQAATDAWKKAVTSSRWRGRFEGFAIGLGAGYLGGRVK